MAIYSFGITIFRGNFSFGGILELYLSSYRQVKLSSLFLGRISSHVCDINISPLHVVTFFSDPHLVLRVGREFVEKKDPPIFHLNSSFPSFD